MVKGAHPLGMSTPNKNLNLVKFSASLTILQHNVLAWTHNRKYELYNAYRQVDPDVLLINAHGCTGGNKIKLYGYSVYQLNAFDQLHDGVAVAVRNNLKHVILDNFDENYLAIQIETTLGPTLIATGYQPPRRPIVPLQSLLQIFRRNTLPVIFMGDINARHPVLGHNNSNPTGEALAHLIRQETVQHLGPDFKTFINTRSTGTPDIILANNRMIHNTYIRAGPLTSSDHLPVILKLSAAPIQVPITPRLNKKEANWVGFEEELSNYIIPDLDGRPATEIDYELSNWYLATDRAIKNNIPTTKYKTLPHPAMNNEIRRAIQTYNTVRQHAEINGWSPAARNLIKTLQNNLQQEFRQMRDDHWNNLITSVDNQYKHPDKFWASIKRLMGSDNEQTKYLLDPNGRKLTTAEDQATEFKRVWGRIYRITENENADFCTENEASVRAYLANTNDHRPYETILLNRLRPDYYLTKPITYHEVQKKIRNLKNRKAPGHSQIDKEILSHMPTNMVKALTAILNASLSAGYFPSLFKLAILKLILKSGKNPTDSQNYRPISLLDITGKIYEKLINERFRQFLEHNNGYHPNQHAYRRRRGTNTAIALAYETIARHQQNRAQCNVIFRDVSKAFDKVWHDGLKYKLCNLHMPRNFTALLCHFLDNRRAIIQVGSYKTDPIPLLCGVPQGSTVAPTLYTLYTSDLGEIPHCKYLTYADDVTQIITYPGKSKQFLQLYTERAITSLNEYERKWKIRTNHNKFQILHISKQRPLPITINNRNINYTNKAKMLGLTMKKTGIAAHTKEIKQKANVALKKLKRFTNLQPRTKLHLYKAFVLPVLEYPAIPLNTLTKSNWKSLQAVQNKALRWVDGATLPNTITAAELHEIYDIMPLNCRNFQAAYRDWENIRTQFEDDVQQLLEIETPGTHAWWPLAYLQADARGPQPIIT